MVKLLLKEYLQAQGQSVYGLVQEAARQGKRLSRTNLYNLTSGEAKGIQFETLSDLLDVLPKLTGKPVELTDLLEYRKD